MQDEPEGNSLTFQCLNCTKDITELAHILNKRKEWGRFYTCSFNHQYNVYPLGTGTYNCYRTMLLFVFSMLHHFYEILLYSRVKSSKLTVILSSVFTGTCRSESIIISVKPTVLSVCIL